MKKFVTDGTHTKKESDVQDKYIAFSPGVVAQQILQENKHECK